MPSIIYLWAVLAIAAAVVVSRPQLLWLRKSLITVCCVLLAGLSAVVVLVGPRLAHSGIDKAWTAEAARGANAMYDVYLWLFGLAVLIGAILALLASRPK